MDKSTTYCCTFHNVVNTDSADIIMCDNTQHTTTGYYDCTGSSASPANVQKAWRRLARSTHPDTSKTKDGEHANGDLFNDADKLKTVRVSQCAAEGRGWLARE